MSRCLCKISAVLCLAGGVFLFSEIRAQTIAVNPQEFERIGERIFLNECGGDERLLLAWNEGEDFMSLGLGHFIWYPPGVERRFEERFPAFLAYAEDRGAVLPPWLRLPSHRQCPWPDRAAYLRERSGPKAEELRVFLAGTKALQTAFIIGRFEASVPVMLASVPEAGRAHLRAQLDRVASTEAGVYALVDYVNFKGEGISPLERYRGQGWGLRQVLEGMRGDGPGAEAVAEFVRVAGMLLAARVANAPPERHEERWLAGWKNRLQTYRAALAEPAPAGSPR